MGVAWASSQADGQAWHVRTLVNVRRESLFFWQRLNLLDTCFAKQPCLSLPWPSP